ncbi:uncharacterized protein LOC101205771 isoform X2 [Cucumis sativus]|uniref:uncharacterized protein LOC101205771 isoform X2 n=1 Tax=Cucumis sativus TaxID=3659 RepID=UPI0005ED2C61|nr:uncharacterized protein LOC101205771 isoform X2 [Cucumis sativus]
MKGNLHFLLFIFYDRSHSVCLQFLPYPSRFYVPAIETHFHFPTVAFRPYLWNASHKTRLLHLLRFLPIVTWICKVLFAVKVVALKPFVNKEESLLPIDSFVFGRRGKYCP